MPTSCAVVAKVAEQPPRRAVPDVPPPPPGAWPLAASAAVGRAAPGGPAPATRPSNPAIGLGLSAAAIALYLVGQLGLQLIATLVLVDSGLLDPANLDPAAGGPTLLALVVGSQVFGLAAVLVLLRRRRAPLREIVGPLRPIGRHVRLGVGLGLLAIVGSTIVVSALVALSGSEATPDQVLTAGIAESPLQIVLAVAAAVIMAPLAEELLFRGLLHRGLRRRLSLAPATVISSVLFSIVHVDVAVSQPLALVGLALVGALMAVAYERTGSLIVPILIHAVHNGVTILAVVVTSRFDVEGIAILARAVPS